MNWTDQSTATNLWRLWNLANYLWLKNFKLGSSNCGKVLNLKLEDWKEFSTESFEEAKKFLLNNK